jgi:hypothetical protein
MILPCPNGVFCRAAVVPVHVNETETDFAYGDGVQARLRPFALRAEYERTETSVGRPRLLSLGVTWTF